MRRPDPCSAGIGLDFHSLKSPFLGPCVILKNRTISVYKTIETGVDPPLPVENKLSTLEYLNNSITGDCMSHRQITCLVFLHVERAVGTCLVVISMGTKLRQAELK